MFEGSEEELGESKVSEGGVFVEWVIWGVWMGDDLKGEMSGGEWVGEFWGLVGGGGLCLEDGVKVVYGGGMGMEKGCEGEGCRMGGMIGLGEEKVEEMCEGICKEGEVVVGGNYKWGGEIVM